MTTLSDKIAEVEKLLAGATPGPWWDDSEESLYVMGWEDKSNHKKQQIAYLQFDKERYGDHKLICAAPTLIASMLEVVKAGYALLSKMPINIPSDPQYPAVNRYELNILNKSLSKFSGNEGGGNES